jgi:hypothetical protein
MDAIAKTTAFGKTKFDQHTRIGFALVIIDGGIARYTKNPT